MKACTCFKDWAAPRVCVCVFGQDPAVLLVALRAGLVHTNAPFVFLMLVGTPRLAYLRGAPCLRAMSACAGVD